MRKKEREGGEWFRALESFLRTNTDLSTRRHSWKRNLIREKLNSFKCTSRSLFAPYLPSLSPVPLFPSSSPYSPAPLIRSLQPPERPPRFPSPLSTLAPFSYPLILSQPFSLRKRRSASSSSFLSFLSFPFHFLSVSLSLSFSSFLCVVQGRSTSLLAFFFSPFLYIRKTSCFKFLFYHSIPD